MQDIQAQQALTQQQMEQAQTQAQQQLAQAQQVQAQQQAAQAQQVQAQQAAQAQQSQQQILQAQTQTQQRLAQVAQQVQAQQQAAQAQQLQQLQQQLQERHQQQQQTQQLAMQQLLGDIRDSHYQKAAEAGGQSEPKRQRVDCGPNQVSQVQVLATEPSSASSGSSSVATQPGWMSTMDNIKSTHAAQSKFAKRGPLEQPKGKSKSQGHPSKYVSQYSYPNLVHPENKKDFEKTTRGVVTSFRSPVGPPTTVINGVELCSSYARGDTLLTGAAIPNVFFVCTTCTCTFGSPNQQHTLIMNSWKATWPQLQGRTFSITPAICWCGQVRTADAVKHVC
jgi:hypothetical protein